MLNFTFFYKASTEAIFENSFTLPLEKTFIFFFLISSRLLILQHCRSAEKIFKRWRL